MNYLIYNPLSNSNTGNVFIVQLESYIHNEIIDYCMK